MSRRDGFLVVRVGDTRYGVPLVQIRQTADLQDIQRVPSSLDALVGIVTLGSHLVPVLHLGALIGAERAPRVHRTSAVLVRGDARTLALAVDDVERVCREPWHPVPSGRDWPWALGAFPERDHVVPIVDVTALSQRLAKLEEAAA